jgi:hypothetical protein
MNSEEYKRALKDTRKSVYRGDGWGVLGGILRAIVAKNEPDAPEPRLLPSTAAKRPAHKRKAIKSKHGG